MSPSSSDPVQTYSPHISCLFILATLTGDLVFEQERHVLDFINCFFFCVAEARKGFVVEDRLPFSIGGIRESSKIPIVQITHIIGGGWL